MLKINPSLMNLSSLEPCQVSYRLSSGLSKNRNSSSLVSLRKDRRQMESEAASLANRVSLLNKEEEKIWRNIDLARTKAHEGAILRRLSSKKSPEVYIS